MRYKESVESKWLFPSPVKEGDEPRDPQSLYHRTQLLLERAGCKRVRFHDLRHTFATMLLESGMDVKTLSAMIGHISSATTLDIYSHITNEMQVNAARATPRVSVLLFLSCNYFNNSIICFCKALIS